MEGCSKASAGAASGLPDDPLLEILSRVPAKSVCRFKCVSKAWRDLIADPHNRKKLRQPMQGLFVEAAQVDEDDVTKLSSMIFSFIDLRVRSVPLDIDPSFSFLTEMTGIKTILWDSCNGLILFGHRPEQFIGPHYYSVCNPTTKQWSDVPTCGSSKALTSAYLAFDPDVSSHFHLVQFQMPDFFHEIVALHVYSSETGTWSQNQIDEQKEQGQLEGWHHQCTLDIGTTNHLCGAFVNGFLHVTVRRSYLQHILVVDVQGKARRMIAVPDMADGRHKHTYLCYLGQSQGRLHCMTRSADKIGRELSTWVLLDYDTQEWVLKNTVDLNYLVDIFAETGGFSEFDVVHIHQDCNVVLFLLDSCKLTAYNMESKEMNVIATFKDHKYTWNFARYIPYFSESPALTNKY